MLDDKELLARLENFSFNVNEFYNYLLGTELNNETLILSNNILFYY